MYDVVLSDDAFFVYLRIPSKADADAVDRWLDLLADFPRLGHRYDPIYEAARPPFDLFVASAGRYRIYCEVDDEARRVLVDFIEDQRRDPNARFNNIRGFYG